MNKQKIIKSAKYYAKKWFDNGWKESKVLCVDVTYPDGSREIGIKDADNLHGFDFLYDGNTFATVTYNGKKFTVTTA